MQSGLKTHQALGDSQKPQQHHLNKAGFLFTCEVDEDYDVKRSVFHRCKSSAYDPSYPGAYGGCR